MPWTHPASVWAVSTLLPTAPAEQECTGFNLLCTTRDQQPGPWPVGSAQEGSSNPISCSHVAHPKRSGNLHRGVWRAQNCSCQPHPAAANSCMQLTAQITVRVYCNTPSCEMWLRRGQPQCRADSCRRNCQLMAATAQITPALVSQYLTEAPPARKQW